MRYTGSNETAFLPRAELSTLSPLLLLLALTLDEEEKDEDPLLFKCFDVLTRSLV